MVSAFDRGFIFGDGVYEVIPIFGGLPFRLPQHLTRLKRNLKTLSIEGVYKETNWKDLIKQLIGPDVAADQSIYLQITRGAAARDHCFPEQSEPTIFAFSQTLSYPSSEDIENGVRTITMDDVRWSRCDIKSISLLGNVLARQQAKEAGVTESILIREGQVTEGAASNIFIVNGNIAVTPPKSRFLLPGITRDLVIELMDAKGIKNEERPISDHELFAAKEVWMTSSMKEILPVVKVDHKQIGNGKPGKLFKKVFSIYQDYKSDFREGKVK